MKVLHAGIRIFLYQFYQIVFNSVVIKTVSYFTYASYVHLYIGNLHVLHAHLIIYYLSELSVYVFRFTSGKYEQVA